MLHVNHPGCHLGLKLPLCTGAQPLPPTKGHHSHHYPLPPLPLFPPSTRSFPSAYKNVICSILLESSLDLCLPSPVCPISLLLLIKNSKDMSIFAALLPLSCSHFNPFLPDFHSHAFTKSVIFTISMFSTCHVQKSLLSLIVLTF